jgi:hypothetical protein
VKKIARAILECNDATKLQWEIYDIFVHTLEYTISSKHFRKVYRQAIQNSWNKEKISEKLTKYQVHSHKGLAGKIEDYYSLAQELFILKLQQDR